MSDKKGLKDFLKKKGKKDKKEATDETALAAAEEINTQDAEVIAGNLE